MLNSLFDEEQSVSTESLINSETESHVNYETKSHVNSETENHVNCVTETNSKTLTNYLIGFTISLLVLAAIFVCRRTKLFSKFKIKKKVRKRFLQKNISPLSNIYSTGGGKHLNSRMKGISKYFSKRHSLGPSSIRTAKTRSTRFITSSQQLSDEFDLASRNYSWGSKFESFISLFSINSD